MKLEADPTVIYGLLNYDGNITKKDLSTEHSYNTYKIKGLPPGPIASAGYEALYSALYPVKTKFLYFVAKKNRTHKFSETLRKHTNAVNKYQRNGKVKK